MKQYDDPVHITAHKMKGPFSFIYSSADLLLTGIAGELNPQQKDLVDRILKNAEEGLKMVEDFLEDAK